MRFNSLNGVSRCVFPLLALFVLNALLSMSNWWPTPFVYLDTRLSPELLLLLGILLVAFTLGLRLGRRAITLLSTLYFLLVLGRYFDTTAPALFGRAINLYWDGSQIPRLLWVLAQRHPWWLSGLVGLGIVLGLVLLFVLTRWALRVTLETTLPYAARRWWTWCITAMLVGVAIANFLGVQATWPYIARPVIPTYFAQAKTLWAALREGTGATVLPPSPAFDSDLGHLRGADFNLFFFESYGAITYDNAQMSEQLAPQRQALQALVTSKGMQVVSAFVTSTTFAGGTDLAHMAFLTGIDTRDPLRHDVLLTTERPTLIRHFRAKGYETIGFYPGLDWDWPEGAFFGYERLVDARALEYRGPQLGYWKIPDQVALARFQQRFPLTRESKPRMLFFTSSSSHMPFHPVPPYQPDWAKASTDVPFDPAVVAQLQARKTDWLNMRPSYTGMIDYNFQWLRGLLEQPATREFVMLVLGDHQPVSSVTGEGASWDVPVHFISAKPELTQRLLALGFTAGMQPARQSIGGLAELAPLLLKAMDTKASLVAPK
jgi:Fe2+ transport system protein FeoA